MGAARISVTEVDSYRYWKAQDDMTIDDLLRRLNREEPPTEAMAVGIALHAALEKAQEGEFSSLSQDGYTFCFPANLELSLPDVREVKAEKRYQIDGIDVTLVGKVDAIHGRRVEDHKTTSRGFDPEALGDTYQWRFYLDMFDADVFRWNVFVLKDEAPQTFSVRALEQFEQTRYPGMAGDCYAALSEFVEVLRRHLPHRIQA